MVDYTVTIDESFNIVYSQTPKSGPFSITEAPSLIFTDWLDEVTRSVFLFEIKQLRKGEKAQGYFTGDLLMNNRREKNLSWTILPQKAIAGGDGFLLFGCMQQRQAAQAGPQPVMDGRLIMEYSEEAFVFYDRALRVWFFNNSASDRIQLYCGNRLQIGNHLRDYLRPTDLPIALPQYEGALQGEVHNRMVEIPIPGAGIRVHNVHVGPVRNSEGEIVGVVATSRDVSAELDAQNQNLRTEDRLSYLMESSGDALLEIGTDQLELLYTKNLLEQLGHAPVSPEQIKDRIWDLLHPEDRILVTRIAGEYKDGLIRQHEIEIRFLSASGRYMWILSRGRLRSGQGPRRVIITHIDITRLKESLILLQENELRWKLALEGTNQGVWEMDFENNTGFLSEKTAKDLGYGQEEGTRTVQFWYTVLHPEDMERGMTNFYQALKGERPFFNGTYRLICKNGEIKWISVKGAPVKRKEGKTLRMLGVHEDVTERILRQQELEIANKKWQFALEGSGQGVWELDLEAREVAFSSKWLEMFGLPNDSPTESFEASKARIHPEDWEKLRESLLATVKAETEYFENVSRMKTPGGSYRWCLIRGKVLTRSASGQARGMVGTSSDISNLINVQEALRKSNERFIYAAKAASDIIWEMNFETREFLVAEDPEKFFDILPGKIGWDTARRGDYVFEEDRQRVRDSFRQARYDTKKAQWEMEYRLLNSKGEKLEVNNRAWFIRDAEGRVLRVIGAIKDISERRKMEKDLADQQRRAQLHNTRTAIRAQEKERTEIGRELHDNINQVLASTKLYLETIQGAGEPTQTILQKATENLNFVINENRRMSKNLVTPDLKRETLVELIEDLVNSLRSITRISIQPDVEPDLDKSLTDEQKLALYRIVQEQTSNIIKYSRASQARISIHSSGNKLSLVISDNGVGANNKTKPTGIGLKNIAGRISVLEGDMRVITGPDQGFVLEVEFPLVPAGG